MARHKRRKKFIDRAVQSALIVLIVRQWTLYLLGTAFFVFCLEVCLGEPHYSLTAYLESTWNRISIVLIPTVLLAPVFVYEIVKLSNRFVGPMFRIRRELQRLANRQPAYPIKLRKGDFWHEAADDYNRVLDEIKNLRQATDDEAAESTDAEHQPQRVASPA